jgi:purine-binding chemotaxis protein CheW
MPAFLLFTLDAQRFALPVAAVRETVPAVAVTPLAGAPGVVEGLVDVGGTATPVLDLRARFGLPARPVSTADHLVLAEAGARPVALRVDRAVDVVLLDDDAVSAARPGETALRHLAGVAHLDDGLVLIADLEAFLSQAESQALAAALAREGAAAPPSGAPPA